MRNLIALVSGLIFGLGLIAGGMTNPAKIKGFLDLFGSWDPSLALVMGGAIAVAVFAFTAAKQRDRSWTGNSMVRLMHRSRDVLPDCAGPMTPKISLR